MKTSLMNLIVGLVLICEGRVSAAADQQVVPLKIVNGITAVTCSFNDVEVPFGCILDLGNGSYQPILPNSVVKRFSGLKPAGAGAPSISGIPSCRAKKISSMKIGNISIPAKWIYACSPGFGLGNVGVSSLDHAVWKLDLVRNTLEKIDGIPARLNSEPLIRKHGLLAISAALGTTHFLAELDTGAMASQYNKEFVQANLQSFKLRAGEEVYEDGDLVLYERTQNLVTNGIGFAPGEMMTALDMAAKKQYNDVPKDGVSAVFGMEFLKDHVWYFDLVNQQWAVEAN